MPSSLIDAFRRELARSSTVSADPDELLPDRLAGACVAVLPFDGASLTFNLLPDRRLPWGSSDPVAAAAERVQFALGEGPCVTAHRDRATSSSTWETLQHRWPHYADRLARDTDYRCAVALPVGGPLAGVGVLSLYRRESGPVADEVLGAAEEVAGLVGEALVEVLGSGTAPGMPMTLRSAAVESRQRVWLAIGFLAGSQTVSSAQALGLLRAMAFSEDADLETVAGRVLVGDLPE